MFRPATADDVPFILELLREFYGKAGSIYGIDFHGPSTIQTITQVIACGVCLVGPSSCAGALLCEFPYNRRAIVAQVAYWYFRSSLEVRIFDALMQACKEAGATHINAASLYPRNSILKRYERLGLRKAECQAIRAL